MGINMTTSEPTDKLPEGFFYIGQDNYYIARGDNGPGNRRYLYSDSATSCVIVIIEGSDPAGNPLVALSHLSRPERFRAFFDIVSENFSGGVSVYAQGGNPPERSYRKDSLRGTFKYDYTSLRNSNLIVEWIAANTDAVMKKRGLKWYIDQATVSLGTGDPQLQNRGCLGIDLETMIVSNQSFVLKPEDRDPDEGIQTLFCVFGLDLKPQMVLQKAGEEFSEKQVMALVTKAKSNGWLDILDMSEEEILHRCSSTPDDEVPWFCEAMIKAAEFVKNYRG